MAGRPYKDIEDFTERCKLSKTPVIELIKAGAFDKYIDSNDEDDKTRRKVAMEYYLRQNSNLKKKINLQNMNGLIQYNLIPEKYEKQKQAYLINKELKKNKYGSVYFIPAQYKDYFNDKDIVIVKNEEAIPQKEWEKIYEDEMDILRAWMKNNQEQILNQYNDILFKEVWDKYAAGSVSAWEMESLCFYYHEHELANVDRKKYGIVNFNSLPENPEVDYFFRSGGREIPIYKLYRIAGTVIGKNDIKSSISLLTVDGVVNVKFNKEYYALYNRQLSEVQPDGTKKIVDKSWFTRGNKIVVTGYRREDSFRAKRYNNVPGHTLYKIQEVKEDGSLILTHDR